MGYSATRFRNVLGNPGANFPKLQGSEEKVDSVACAFQTSVLMMLSLSPQIGVEKHWRIPLGEREKSDSNHRQL